MNPTTSRRLLVMFIGTFLIILITFGSVFIMNKLVREDRDNTPEQEKAAQTAIENAKKLDPNGEKIVLSEELLSTDYKIYYEHRQSTVSLVRKLPFFMFGFGILIGGFTVFLAIINVNDGTIQTANAGHEYPVVRPAGKSFDFVRDKHGFVIGGVPNMTYTTMDFTAHPGDMFFVYTDGLLEANDADEEQFGEERLLAALNSIDTDDPKELIDHVRDEVNSFVGLAPQFDDLTMMAMTYYGKQS